MKSAPPAIPAGIALMLAVFGSGISPADAAAQGLYAGVGLGQSRPAFARCSPEIRAAFLDTSCRADDTDTAFRIFGGLNLATASESAVSMALELGYIDFGKASLSGADSFYGVSRMTASSRGFDFSIVGSVGVTDRLSLLGRIGLLRWESEFENLDQVESFSEDATGTDVAFGLGASLALREKTEGRLEWERFKIDDDAVDLLSASILFEF